MKTSRHSDEAAAKKWFGMTPWTLVRAARSARAAKRASSVGRSSSAFHSSGFIGCLCFSRPQPWPENAETSLESHARTVVLTYAHVPEHVNVLGICREELLSAG